MYVPRNVSDRLAPRYKNLAGIYVKMNREGYTKAIVIGWDWNRVYSDCGLSPTDLSDFDSYKWWWSRLRSDVILMDHQPEEYVSELLVKDLGNQGSVKAMNTRWMAVGANPLVELGIISSEKNTSTSTPAVTPTTTPGFGIIVAMAGVLVAMGRRRRTRTR